jgi:hypothetical protein
MEGILGITQVEHCQHCSPQVEWIQNEPGKPPEFFFRGFPRDGWTVLSKKRVIVLCKACTGSAEIIRVGSREQTPKC